MRHKLMRGSDRASELSVFRHRVDGVSPRLTSQLDRLARLRLAHELRKIVSFLGDAERQSSLVDPRIHQRAHSSAKASRR